MLILAIDTALDACAAAVLDTDTSELVARESQPMTRGHAEALMPLIARVIRVSGLTFAALDRIAVTTGPGSFTGLFSGGRWRRQPAAAAAPCPDCGSARRRTLWRALSRWQRRQNPRRPLAPGCTAAAQGG